MNQIGFGQDVWLRADQDLDASSISSELQMPPPVSEYLGRRAVVVISGSKGPKKGYISPLPSRLLLHPGRKFINSLVVNLRVEL